MKTKVSANDVEAAIQKVEYTLLQDGRTTIALLTLDNGFTVRGESSCVDKANYDPEIGQAIALDNAKREVWKFLGFRLADELALVSIPIDILHDETAVGIVAYDGDTSLKLRLVSYSRESAATGKASLLLEKI